uniref:Uncharacterized protein n=1 Tax=Eutreptiella gymnastica TaxID=73025 RepID=A0A7S4CHD7_9EUGL
MSLICIRTGASARLVFLPERNAVALDTRPVWLRWVSARTEGAEACVFLCDMLAHCSPLFLPARGVPHTHTPSGARPQGSGLDTHRGTPEAPFRSALGAPCVKMA